MRPRDVTVPKHHHWGMLPSYRKQEGGGAATGRKGRMGEEDAWGRKNATMEHLVGLVQKR